MLSRIRSQLPLWRRALRRRRRTLTVLAATLLVAALVPSALPALLPGASRSVSVVVASTDLPAGTTLDSAHLETVRVAEDLVPPQTETSPEQLQGRSTAVAVPSGTPLLPGMLEGEVTGAVPEGAALIAISAPAVLGPHLSPGTMIEILSSTPEAGTTRSTRAQVVEVSPDDDEATAALGASSPSQTVLLVTVDAPGARDLAHAFHEGWMTITVIG